MGRRQPRFDSHIMEGRWRSCHGCFEVAKQYRTKQAGEVVATVGMWTTRRNFRPQCSRSTVNGARMCCPAVMAAVSPAPTFFASPALPLHLLVVQTRVVVFAACYEIVLAADKVMK